MPSFPTDRIRNVALVGHGGAGKTTLTESLLFVTGAITRRGRVEDGNTVSDFDAEEQRRGHSTMLAVTPFEFEGHRVNLIDTPGAADFVSEVAIALRVADFAVFVVSAVDGVGVQTMAAWQLASELGVPRAVFVNQLDRERADFERTLTELQERLGAGIAPLELPIGSEAKFLGVIDLLEDHAMTYDDSGVGKLVPIPDELANREHMVHDALVEGIVVADDALMERYLADEAIALDELEHALAAGIDSATVFPVLCGSARKLVGVDRLARFLVHEGPAPHADPDAPTVALVFKTVVDPYVGRINFAKVLQGRINADDHLTNSRTMTDERLHHLMVVRGKEQTNTTSASAGDIVAIAKLSDTATGDVLGVRGTALHVPPLALPDPVYATAIAPHNRGEDDKLANALRRLIEEDPSLRADRSEDTHQLLLKGMGDMHVSIAIDKITRRFGVPVDVSEVKVPYRETITGRAEAEGKHKKQSGGHGQFAVASVRVEPLERGAGFRFVDAIVGGAIPRQFIPAVEKGVHDALGAGVFGVPVVDLQVTCLDGKFHPVDSSEMAFRTAGLLAVREAMAGAGPTLLEPVSELVVTAPASSQGDLLGDLNQRRGRIRHTTTLPDGSVQVVASVPTAELGRYAIDLRSITAGRGSFTLGHSHYDPAPPPVVERVKAEHAQRDHH